MIGEIVYLNNVDYKAYLMPHIKHKAILKIFNGVVPVFEI